MECYNGLLGDMRDLFLIRTYEHYRVHTRWKWTKGLNCQKGSRAKGRKRPESKGQGSIGQRRQVPKGHKGPNGPKGTNGKGSTESWVKEPMVDWTKKAKGKKVQSQKGQGPKRSKRANTAMDKLDLPLDLTLAGKGTNRKCKH